MRRLLVVNRPLDPGSEFGVHRQWYLSTAMDPCWERASRWPRRIACIAAWIGCWNINRNSFYGNARSGPTCFKRAAVLEKLAEIQMIDVWIPTVDQRWLILPRCTQPSADTKLLIEKLRLELPSQPSPRLTGQEDRKEMEVQSVRHGACQRL